MKRVLTIQESSGKSPQDVVRGRIFKPLFAKDGVQADYAGRIPGLFTTHVTGHARIIGFFLRSIPGRLITKIFSPLVTWAKERWIFYIAGRYDVIHLIKVESSAFVAQLRRRSKARLVYDIADAMWLPRNSPKEKNLQSILSMVDAVTCDNSYVLSYSSSFNKHGYLYPSASQVESFDVHRPIKKPSDSNGKITLGWIGSPSTLFNLFLIWEALEDVFKAHKNIHLHIVGVGYDSSLLPRFENVNHSTVAQYDSRTMVDEVLKMDIGLFPLMDVENSLARGILKALIYMSGEAAVVASPIGDCPDLITNEVNGLLAEGNNDWTEKIGMLIRDHSMRKKIATEGLKTVREKYTLIHSYEHLKKALNI